MTFPLDVEDGDQYGYVVIRPEIGVSPSPGEKLTYNQALALYSGAGTVGVAYISGLDTSSPTVTAGAGTPSHIYTNFSDDGGGPARITSVDMTTSYDRGGTNVEHDPDGGASVFLVGLVGASAGSFIPYEYGTTENYVAAGPMYDGGQSVSIGTDSAAPFYLLTAKIWRIAPGEAPPGPPDFWTNFIGSREIL